MEGKAEFANQKPVYTSIIKGKIYNISPGKLRSNSNHNGSNFAQPQYGRNQTSLRHRPGQIFDSSNRLKIKLSPLNVNEPFLSNRSATGTNKNKKQIFYIEQADQSCELLNKDELVRSNEPRPHKFSNTFFLTNLQMNSDTVTPNS